MVKKVKCNVCNHKFLVDKEKITQFVETSGLTTILKEVKVYDAMDCPKCGCQKVLWPRFTEKVETRK